MVNLGEDKGIGSRRLQSTVSRHEGEGAGRASMRDSHSWEIQAARDRPSGGSTLEL